MKPSILVTGGAGFIGSHVVELLLERGYPVTVYDKLVEQVHGTGSPQHVPPEARFIQGDVCDRDALSAALSGIDQVIHLAAEVGVGQSMYEISRYVDANTGGTGVLLDLITNEHRKVSRIVVASSMSIYGEGEYLCTEHGSLAPQLRTDQRLAERLWEVTCPKCGLELKPIGTTEAKPLHPSSVYAISKMDQELLCLAIGAAYGIGTVALRYFNAYGPRQALSNPYTGVAAIFAGRLLNGNAPAIFEDGMQRRDFIHVRDVARATVLALETNRADGEAINVGVGDPMTVQAVGLTLSEALGVDIQPQITGQFRSGDIRHCWADVTKAQQLLGFTAETAFADGIKDLVGWLSTQTADDQVDRARAELEQRGLAR